MNRTLSMLLTAAAVVGATSGTLVAGLITGDGAGGAGPTDQPATSIGSTPTLGSVSGRALWADKSALHDGDTTVPLDLIDPPVDVQRLADGWLVNTSSDVIGVPLYESTVVRPDGTSTFLAQTIGPGEVSPDGNRYIAGTLDSYTIWDVTTGQVVETVDQGWTPDAVVVDSEAQAQYVDDDTVVTTWTNRFTGTVEVVRSGLGDDSGPRHRSLVADDVLGEWGVSPDGRWFVASLIVPAEGRTAPDTEGCTLLRSMDGSVDDVRDCAVAADGVPSFAQDSSAVLTTVVGGSRAGAVRPVPLGEAPERPDVEVPSGTVRAVYLDLDPDRVTVLARGGSGGGSIRACDAVAGCRDVDRTSEPATEVALGG